MERQTWWGKHISAQQWLLVISSIVAPHTITGWTSICRPEGRLNPEFYKWDRVYKVHKTPKDTQTLLS